MASSSEDIEKHEARIGDSSGEQVGSDSDSENSRAAFLSTFTAAEDKAVMRKVDRRFLLLIGLMYIIKNVCVSRLSKYYLLIWNPD